MRDPLLLDPFITDADYYAREADSPVKHEHFNGRIFAVAGGTPAHAQAIANVTVALGSRLRGRSCYTTSADQRVKVEANDLKTYPDVMIVCPPARYDEADPNTLLNPVLIVEVLSPSTADYDRTFKWDSYQQMPSLRHYILVEPTRVRVEHFARADEGGWIQRVFHRRADVISLPDLELEVPIDEIYERLEAPEGLILVRED